jgi:hypothetical protein
MEKRNLKLSVSSMGRARFAGGAGCAHSVAVFAMYYNFVRIHKTLRTTPAMAAGVTKRPNGGCLSGIGSYRKML